MTCFHQTRLRVLLAGGFALSAAATLARPASADPAVTARAQAAARDIRDVVLTSEGRLCGCAVDRGGVPTPGERVLLGRDGFPPQQVTTDPQGQFHFDAVPQGVYDLCVGDQHSVIRVWSPATAPPSANPLPTLITGQPIVRGQLGGGEAALGVVTLGAAVAGVTVATFASEDGHATTPFIQPAGSTQAGPFQAGQIDMGNTPIPSLRQVTLSTTGNHVTGVDLRELRSP